METKYCPGCSQNKSVEAFNFKHKALGTRQVRCRECTRQQIKRHYEANTAYYTKKARARNKRLKTDNRARLLEYLRTHPCVDCGEADVVCLEFDHVRGEKQFNIANVHQVFAWDRIEAEIAKCEVRCANCHRRRTAKAFGYWLSKV